MKKTLFGNYHTKSTDDYIQNLKKEYEERLAEKEKEIVRLTEKTRLHDKQITEIGEAIVYAKSFIVESKKRLEKEEEEIRQQIQANHLLLKQSIQTEIDALIEKRALVEKEYNDFQKTVQQNVSRLNTLVAPKMEIVKKSNPDFQTHYAQNQ